jgi:1,3-propanediol dehydrogenase
LLPYVLEYGIKVCPEKVARMGNILGENLKGLSVVAAADRVVESLRASLGVDQLPGRLSEVGVEEQHLSQTAAKLLEVPFLEALPEPVSSQELFTYLKDAL